MLQEKNSKLKYFKKDTGNVSLKFFKEIYLVGPSLELKDTIFTNNRLYYTN